MSNLDLNKYQMDGDLLKIFTYPSPVLTKVASDIEATNDEIKTLCKDMLYTMYQSPGIGLAAPQIGKSIRVFVIDVDYEREAVVDSSGEEKFEYANFKPHIFINPKIIEKEGEISYEEGCLSVPGVYESVKRFENIKVEYLDIFGEKQVMEADGLLSICIQHENDHLDGIVFLDRLSPFKKNYYKKKIAKQKKK